MFSANVMGRSVRACAQRQNTLSACAQKRGAATLRDIELRLKSVKNIEKITKSMKMIATTKLTKAQKTMEVARVYGEASQAVFKHAGTTSPTEGTTALIPLSSDRGLCGGINSAISKAVKRSVAAKPESILYIVGDKAKAQLKSMKNIQLVVSKLAKNGPNFLEAGLVTEAILDSKASYQAGSVFFNEFKSVISYETKDAPIYTKESVAASEKLATFEIEEDILDNFVEFSMANRLYSCMADGFASEISARRNAMENASKNAGELIDKLTMTFNRTRQAVITNELCDIITGASAL